MPTHKKAGQYLNLSGYVGKSIVSVDRKMVLAKNLKEKTESYEIGSQKIASRESR